MEAFFGILTTFFMLVIAVFGVPGQIRMNYAHNRNGMKPMLIYSIFGMTFTRSIYSILIGSWYLLIPDAISTFLNAILIIQIYSPRALITKLFFLEKWRRKN